MAREIGLSGWVRNLPDGRVECEAVGPKEGIEEFLEWLSKGPTTAKVTELQLVVREKAGAQPAEAVAFSIK
jgi:acylphosphatase